MNYKWTINELQLGDQWISSTMNEIMMMSMMMMVMLDNFGIHDTI
jgi:hypothetical protein